MALFATTTMAAVAATCTARSGSSPASLAGVQRIQSSTAMSSSPRSHPAGGHGSHATRGGVESTGSMGSTQSERWQPRASGAVHLPGMTSAGKGGGLAWREAPRLRMRSSRCQPLRGVLFRPTLSLRQQPWQRGGEVMSAAEEGSERERRQERGRRDVRCFQGGGNGATSGEGGNKLAKQEAHDLSIAYADVMNGSLGAAPSTSSPHQQPRSIPLPPESSSILEVLPYLWRLAADDTTLRWRIAAALVFLIIGKAAGLCGPLMFKKGLDSLSSTQSLTRAAALSAVAALVMSALSKGVSAMASELRNIIFAPVGQATGRRVEFHFLAHILQMDLAFHLDRKTGALARVIERGKRSIVSIFRAVVFTFIPTAVELLLVCCLLANHISPSFAAVVFLTFFIYVAWTIALTSASVAIRRDVNRLDGLATSKVVDVLLNFETVVQFNNQQMDLLHYDSLLQQYQAESIRLDKISSLLNGSQSVIVAIGLAVVMAMAGVRVASGLMTVGDLVLVNGLILQLSLPLQFLGFLYRDLRQSLVDLDAMFGLLRMKPALVDGELLLPSTAAGACIEVSDVSFSYNPSQPVLRGVSFSVPSGSSVALVGPSGSGKSSIVKLLLRLYAPTAGGISVDGFDIASLQQESLRQAISVVPQETILFNDTIRYNIAYGKPSATDEEIIAAAKQAELHDAILRMKDGYSTLVGERGLKLSGGEKQRVAIARAFLKSPRLLICDEATSSLDSGTEAAILKSLKKLAAGRSCLFVAHRLSTIRHCDEILVLERGEIIERGTHDELIKRGSKYAAMWQLQESGQMTEAAMAASGWDK